MSGQPARFWIEVSLGTATAFLAALTVVWRDWIEAIFQVDPDGHGGSLEWLIVVALLCATSMLTAAACAAWRPREPAVRSPSG
jgi:hypothetical protein